MDKRLFCKDKWRLVTGWEACCADINNIPAIYVIYLDKKLSYIGQSNTPRFRFHQHKLSNYNHLYQTPWGVFSDMYIKIKFPSKYGREAMIEKRLIKKLKPRFNKYTYKRKAMVTM